MSFFKKTIIFVKTKLRLNLEKPKKHFRIPDENVRFEKVTPSRGGKTFTCNDYTSHASYLAKRSSLVSASMVKKEDYEWSKNLFLNIKSPKDVAIKSGKAKLKALGFEILSLIRHHKNVCLARISKEKFASLEEKIHRYANESGNPGKSNLSILDDIEEVEADEKLSTLPKSNDNQTVIIYLYNSLSQKERFLILNHLDAELANKSIETESQVFANGATAVSCQTNYSTLASIVDSYSTVNKVETNAVFYIKGSIRESSLPSVLTINPPLSNSVVAIIDSRIESLSTSNFSFMNIIGEVVKKYHNKSIVYMIADVCNVCNWLYFRLMWSRYVKALLYGLNTDVLGDFRNYVSDVSTLYLPIAGRNVLGVDSNRLVSAMPDQPESHFGIDETKRIYTI